MAGQARVGTSATIITPSARPPSRLARLKQPLCLCLSLAIFATLLCAAVLYAQSFALLPSESDAFASSNLGFRFRTDVRAPLFPMAFKCLVSERLPLAQVCQVFSSKVLPVSGCL